MWVVFQSSALSIAQATSTPPRFLLRWEFCNVAAAVALLSVALVASALFFFRRKTRDLTLIYFSLFCVLYGVRLLTTLGSFRSLFDLQPAFWSYLNWDITCTLLIPFGLFFYQVSGEFFRKSLRWLVAAQMLFAVFGMVAAAFGSSLAKLNAANSILVLTTFFIITLSIFTGWARPEPRQPMTHEMRVFIAGLAVWGLSVVQANLVGLRVLRGLNMEFVGFLAFVICLAYISAHRIFANEERLLAIQKELEIARRIQSSILPHSVPVLSGLDVAARYVPMSAIAGDFYDFLPVDEKRLGVLVADVTGHGIPAALIASMLKVAFASQASHASDPARVLSGLNRALCGKFEEHFVTAAYLFVDLENRLLRYSAAGHPPLIMAIRAQPNVREIQENGLMLGLFQEASYSSVEIQVAPGDRCLLYTDGVLEASNIAREEFGKSRCKEFLQSRRSIPAADFADQLLASIAAFSGCNSGRPQEDDITLLVLDFHHEAP
jgi:sigma-B regulation protein RsbU (phosphoserine phosphatase)